jgi:uncharacterized protein YjbJ (UPF0337 family)
VDATLSAVCTPRHAAAPVPVRNSAVAEASRRPLGARTNRRRTAFALAWSCSLEEQKMRINKDQSEGRAKEAKGTIKEFAGKVTGNESLEARGKVEKTLGKAQAKFGDVKQDLKDASRKS